MTGAASIEVPGGDVGPDLEAVLAGGTARARTAAERLAAAMDKAQFRPKRHRRTGDGIRPGFVERGTAAVADAAYQEGRRLGLHGPHPGERIHPCDVEAFLTEFRRGFRAGRAERAAVGVPRGHLAARAIVDPGLDGGPRGGNAPPANPEGVGGHPVSTPAAPPVQRESA